VVSRLLQEGVGEALYDEVHGAWIVGGGGGRETVNRKRKLSAVFLQPIQNRGLYRTEE
jgi:hypothetical protein